VHASALEFPAATTVRPPMAFNCWITALKYVLQPDPPKDILITPRAAGLLCCSLSRSSLAATRHASISENDPDPPGKQLQAFSFTVGSRITP